MSMNIKKGWLITIAVIALLAFLNPTPDDFNEYKQHDYTWQKRRIGYFLIFSIYEFGCHRYIGFAKNFIYIGQYCD